MRRKHLQFVFAFVLSLFFWSTAQAFTTFPPAQQPIPVKVGLYINDVLALVESNETMNFVGTLTLQWRDKRLVFNQSGAGTRLKGYDTRASAGLLAKIWHPQMRLVGGRGPRQIQMMHVSITPQGVVTWTEQFATTVEIHMNLRRFPFDKQVIEVGLESFVHDAAAVQLQNFSKFSGVAKKAHMRGWRMIQFSAGVGKVNNPLYQKSFSQYYLRIQYDRLSHYFIYQIFAPIILIVLLSFSVFWMLKNPLVNRAAISLTAVLTIVVFEWRILSKLPRVAYHMFTDVFMLISFVIAATTILASIIIDHVGQSKGCLVRICRIGYPLSYFLAILIVGMIYL